MGPVLDPKALKDLRSKYQPLPAVQVDKDRFPMNLSATKKYSATRWEHVRTVTSSEVNLQFVDLVHISVSHPSNFLFYSDSAHYHCTTRLSRTPLQISLSPRATRAVQICH